MTYLDFCKLEVTVVHSLINFKSTLEKFRNVSAISKYFESDSGQWTLDPDNSDTVIVLKFDNSQLSCELKAIDSTDDACDNFIFKVWNVPENTIFNIGDYLLFKWYWESDPTRYTVYHGVIKSISVKRNNADLQTSLKGCLVNQDILYNWSIYAKYPKITYYSEVSDFIQNELNFNFTPMIPTFNNKIKLLNPILTRGKSVGEILEQICQQITKDLSVIPYNVQMGGVFDYPTIVTSEAKDKCNWKFINGNTILIYLDSQLNTKLLNELYSIVVPSVNYNDLIEYTNNGDNFTIQVFGIPTLKSGIVFYIDTTGVPNYVTTKSAYYLVTEIEHNITISDGYVTKVYCKLTQ
jgi:hypothetical protein